MLRDNQIRIGAVLSYLQIFASIIIGIVYTPLMIRLLGKSEYGLYNTVSSVTSMLAVLSLGFNTCYIRYYSKYKNDGHSKDDIYRLNGLFLLIFLVIGVIALVCGLFLCSNLELVFDDGLTPNEYQLARTLLLILTINLSISFPMSVFSNIISAHERFVFLKSLNIIKTVASPFLSIPLLLLGFRSVALVVVTLIISIFVDILYCYYLIFRLKQRFIFNGFERGIIKSIFGYTFFIALHIIVDQINWNVDKIILSRFKGTEETAVYSVGYSLYSYYMSIGLPIASMFTPRIHALVERTRGQNELKQQQLTDLFVKVGRIQWLILGLILTGLVFFGQPFIKLWAGVGYEKSYYVCLLLVIPGTIDLIQNIGIEIQRAQNNHRFRAYTYVAMAVINITLSVFLCYNYGAVGSAIGTALSLLLVQGLLINIYLHKKCFVNILTFWKNIMRMGLGLIIPCLFGIFASMFLNLNSVIVLIISIAVYTLIYAISMFLFGINTYEKTLLKNYVKKVIFLFRHKHSM